MNRAERESWISSIECCADHITVELGYEPVSFILHRYGVVRIGDLQPWQYCEVFNELYAVEADLK